MALEARPLTPSGTQIELTCGDQRAVVTSVGAGLRAYSAGGRDVVDGYGADEMSPGGRGQLLIPFPNRVQGGRYEFGGRGHQLALNEPEAGNASGAHPYLTVATATVDTAILHVPARTVLHSDAHGIPTGSEPVAGTAYDFRRPRPIGPVRLDHAFTDLDRDEDGIARVELRDPEGRVSVTLWVDSSHPYLMVFSGDTLPAAERRRSLAVEPMTCPPNAFRTGEAVVTLEPGESFTSRWGIATRGNERRA